MIYKYTQKNKRNGEKGAAIIMALFFFSIATFVIFQLSQETLTESTLSGQELKKLQSYYAAQAGLEMALLRIKSYQEAKANISRLGQGIGEQFEGQLDLIWQFPLPWPLPMTDDSLSTITKQEGKEVTEKSLISKLNFFHEIQDGGTKIDLNSLGSPIKTISDATMENLMRSFESIILNDEEFRDVHSTQTVREVLNHIADWADPDQESRNGGSEEQFYPDESQRGYPRNQSFMKMSELLMVAGMDELIYDKLKSLGTVYGTFGINVNTADKEALMSIDSQFTDLATTDFIQRRQELKTQTGQDLNREQFDNILYQLGFRNIEDVHSSGIPILFSPLTAFHIESSGVQGEIETIIRAHVVDVMALKDVFVAQLDKSAAPDATERQDDENPPDQTGEPAQETPSSSNNTRQAPQGRPFIIHMEVSL
jgi:type II secretory pathway component PulK